MKLILFISLLSKPDQDKDTDDQFYDEHRGKISQ